MAMKIYRQVTRTYMKTFVQKNSPFMDFEIWPKFSLEPLNCGRVVMVAAGFSSSVFAKGARARELEESKWPVTRDVGGAVFYSASLI